MNYAEEIAKKALEIKAIKLNPTNPFQWASGYQMPIYNDNRMFLFHPTIRQTIQDNFRELLHKELGISDEIVIAGTSTAGIPWASFVANSIFHPMIYIRDKPKDHGLKNQIEGIDAEENLNGQRVILIEDLVSTGGSSVNAVQAIRNANGICDYCFSIFNYGFREAQEMFEGKRPYDKEKTKSLTTPCNVRSILTYDKLLEVAKQTGYINSEQEKMLREWREDPFNWGEKHGFPKIEKTKDKLI
mgnify:CR=1 FL=1